MKKSKIFLFLLILTIFALASFSFAYASEDNNGMTVSNKHISLTDVREINVAVDFGYKPDLSKLKWTLGGKPLSEWKQFNEADYDYTGKPFIVFSQKPYIVGTTVKAKIKFNMIYLPGNDNVTWGVIATWDKFAGNQTLAVKDTVKNKVKSCVMNVKIYDSYHTYDQIKPAINNITHNAKPGRYIQCISLGKSAGGRDINFVILAKDKASVDKYLNETLPMMLEHPEVLQQKIQNKTMGDYKIPIWFSNIHSNETPGTDAIIKLMNDFSTKDVISYKVYDRKDMPGIHLEDTSKAAKTVTLNVKDVLNNEIFLFDFTTNPDGRAKNARQNANGFDLNRDCAFQTQPEAKAVEGAMAKWMPTLSIEFHGFYSDFEIEPCTTPHNPNLEYDLLQNNNLQLGHAMGMAAISNTTYSHYNVPLLDMTGGWEDLAPNYTDYYALSLGLIGTILEIPDPNEESIKCLEYAGFAAANDLLVNKDKLFMSQLEIYRRSIAGLDDKAKVDPYFLDSNNQAVGRPRGDNANYFPEYYVIPVDKSVQKNALEAYGMVEQLLRDGIKVDVSDKAVQVGDNLFPAGSFVVNMHQATRALVNDFLSDGLDVSSFPGVYSENIISMQDTIGFDRYIVRAAGVFDGKTEVVTSVTTPKTVITDKNAANYVIRNTNNDAVRAVNKLLNAGKKVEMLLASNSGFEMGDYVISKDSLDLVKNDYLLDVATYFGSIKTLNLTKATVATLPVTNWDGTIDGSLNFTLKQMGFDVVNDVAKGNVIVSNSATDAKSAILNGKPYIGMGARSMSFIKDSGLLPGFDFFTSSISNAEGLLLTKVAQDDPISAGYAKDTVIYDAQGGYITGVPTGAKVLTTVSSDDNFFKAGYWPDHSGVKGQTLSFSTKVGQANIVVFANSINFRGAQKAEWRMLANAIFISAAN